MITAGFPHGEFKGRVINVKNINVKVKLELNVDSFELGALRSKLKLELHVDNFDLGSLMSKHKVAIYVDKIEGFWA